MTEPTGEDLLAFFSAVLPSQGHYAVFLANDRTHHWTNSLEGLVDLTLRYRLRKDCYFALAAFSQPGRRNGENVQSIKSFWLDLDAGEEKLKKHGPEKVYSDRRAAAVDLKRFIHETEMQPSMVVSSGEGLHVYYTLDKSISPSDWKPRADRLQAFCLEHRLKVDPAVTGDRARVLRAPWTTHPNGRTVQVIHREKA